MIKWKRKINVEVCGFVDWILYNEKKENIMVITNRFTLRQVDAGFI